MKELPLLASFLPEVRASLEGKQSLCTVQLGWGFWESRLFVPAATGFTVCCVW